MLWFVSAHMPWNAISNLELRRSYKAFPDDFVLPSATTSSDISRREYALSLNAIKKQLPARNNVSLTLDGCTSMNKLAITSAIAQCMDWHCALHEVQLAFDEVDRLFLSHFEIQMSIIDQWPTYWSKDSRTFVGYSWSFGAYRRPCALNCDR